MKSIDKHAISTTGIVLWTIGVFAVGAVTSWWAFGAPRGVDLAADSGSTADWVAAICTGVVGVGACWFAFEANRHRHDEAARQERKEKMAKNARLAVILAAANTAGVIHARLEDFVMPDSEDDEPTFELMKVMLHVIQKSLSRHNWAGFERSLLDDASLNALTALELRLLQFEDIAQASIAHYESEPESFDPADLAPLQALVEAGRFVTEAAYRLRELVSALREEV